MATKWNLNLTKGNLGGFILSLLSTVFYLDEIFPGTWIDGGTYAHVVGFVTLLTGITIQVLSPSAVKTGGSK